LTKRLDDYNWDLTEYDFSEFNDNGIHHILEAERSDYRTEWNQYMKENGNYDD